MRAPRLKGFIEQVFREALVAVDPEALVRDALQLRDGVLRVRGIPYRLGPRSQLVVLAIGKAAIPMARGAVAVLGDRIDRCVVVTKSATESAALGLCRVIESAHPIPDERSLVAGAAVLDAVRGLGPSDLVIVFRSSLVEQLRPGVTLEDLGTTTALLLRAGADIWQLNAIRRRLSTLKGGGLARAAAPARIVNVVVSDVLGNPLPVIASGPTVPPESSAEDVRTIVEGLGVWEELPSAVRDALTTPDESARPANVVQTIVVADAARLAHAAAEACRHRGLPTVLCGTRFSGEAREFGRFWAALARSVREDRMPWSPPVALVAAGELTVTVRGTGRGGRNTEMALAAALALEGSQAISIASLASDGDDGISGAAGAVVDETTASALRSRGVSPSRALDDNDSASALALVDALVITGLTGTNVNDLYLAIVEG